MLTSLSCAVDSTAVRHVWQQFSRLNHSVYSAALRGGCCTVLIARFNANSNKRRLLLLLLLFPGFQKYMPFKISAMETVSSTLPISIPSHPPSISS